MPEYDINSGAAGNRRGINFSVHKHQRMTYFPIVYNNIGLAAKYCVQIIKIALTTSIYVCELNHNIPLIMHA